MDSRWHHSYLLDDSTLCTHKDSVSASSLNFWSWIPRSIFSGWCIFDPDCFHWLHIANFADISAPPVCPVAVQFPLCFTSREWTSKIYIFQRRLRKIWNQLPSVSFGLIYMSEGQNETHLWWHYPFKLEEGHIKIYTQNHSFPP